MRRGRGFAPLSDPTLPRKDRPTGNAAQRARRPGPTWGWLVDVGGGAVELTDAHGHRWPMEFVRTLSGSFGSGTEGVHRAPRAHQYDAAGNVTVEGGYVLIDFLDGDGTKPIIMGNIPSLAPSDSAFFPTQSLGSDPDPIRMRATSTKGGHIQVKGLEGGGDFEVEVGGGTFGTGLKMTFDFSSGTITLGMGGVASAAVLGQALVQAVADLAGDLDLVNTAIPTGLSVVPPLMHTTAIIAAAATSVAGAGGPPYLSAINKVE